MSSIPLHWWLQYSLNISMQFSWKLDTGNAVFVSFLCDLVEWQCQEIYHSVNKSISWLHKNLKIRHLLLCMCIFFIFFNLYLTAWYDFRLNCLLHVCTGYNRQQYHQQSSSARTHAHTHNKTSKLHKTHMPIEKNTKTAKMYEL